MITIIQFFLDVVQNLNAKLTRNSETKTVCTRFLTEL